MVRYCGNEFIDPSCLRHDGSMNSFPQYLITTDWRTMHTNIHLPRRSTNVPTDSCKSSSQFGKLNESTSFITMPIIFKNACVFLPSSMAPPAFWSQNWMECCCQLHLPGSLPVQCDLQLDRRQPSREGPVPVAKRDQVLLQANLPPFHAKHFLLLPVDLRANGGHQQGQASPIPTRPCFYAETAQ